MKRIVTVTAACAALAACATYQAYEGPAHSADETAIVRGDAKLNAGLPLALVIRSVDGREVDLRYSSVAVAAGHHVLIVDCQVDEPKGATSRHHVALEALGGESYRLRAEMRPGNASCERVFLERS